MKDLNVLLMIVVIAIVTFMLRAIPFIIFKDKETPEFINYLGKYLPYSVMAMLVVYCLKGTSLIEFPYGLRELIASLIVIILHIYKRNTLLSIVAGTIVYMFLMNVLI